MVCATRAIRGPLRRQMVDWAASLCTVSRTVRNDAVESTVCGRSGSLIARFAHTVRTPTIGVCM
eukprot:10020949-Lingulodinium_polyedra.AAC.1